MGCVFVIFADVDGAVRENTQLRRLAPKTFDGLLANDVLHTGEEGKQVDVLHQVVQPVFHRLHQLRAHIFVAVCQVSFNFELHKD